MPLLSPRQQVTHTERSADPVTVRAGVKMYTRPLQFRKPLPYHITTVPNLNYPTDTTMKNLSAVRPLSREIAPLLRRKIPKTPPLFPILALLLSLPRLASSLSTSCVATDLPPPIVYTIAGSDSGGGAGIQADLHAIHAMGCHGCSAISALTAQNSMGVTKVHAPPPEFLREQLRVLSEDLPPRAVKVGMLGSDILAEEVGSYLKSIKAETNDSKEAPFVIVDPVMISTSGHKLVDDGAERAMIDHVFPYADLLTPNKFEAEALLGRELVSPQDVEDGARELLKMGPKAVLIKGGHSLSESNTSSPKEDDGMAIRYAQDYLLSRPDENNSVERLCDGPRGVWLQTERYDTIHTHGTGCTLSSAIASALAVGHRNRELDSASSGADLSIQISDACVLGKAYVTAGIAGAVQMGQGPGPVAQTEFPSRYEYFPYIALDPTKGHHVQRAFLPMRRAQHSTGTADHTEEPITMGSVLPIVNTLEWVEKLSRVAGITDIQLRIKHESDPAQILEIVRQAQSVCSKTDIRLWINDYWEAAISANVFGVHIGQEDLEACVRNGGLERMLDANLALGISTHSYAELAAAIGVKPSYISLGPVFGTASKKVAFEPQGLDTVTRWRGLMRPEVPLIAIGGIGDADTARKVKDAGADCVAVIGAVTNSGDVDKAVEELTRAMR